MASTRTFSPRHGAAHESRNDAILTRMVAEAADPFQEIDGDDRAVDMLVDRVGDAQVVLIGEATHGTSEFYRMRQRITRDLITRKGFRIVAVEADWPDAEGIDEYVRLRSPRPDRGGREAFSRFPTWMWRNREVLEFTEWLRGWNEPRPAADRAGFFGLDLYSLYTSIAEVLGFVGERDEELVKALRERYACLAPFEGEPAAYGSGVLADRCLRCEEDVIAALKSLLEARLEDGVGLFSAKQNARVVTSAEKYYRLMYHAGPQSWNLRDRHMFDTLVRLMKRGPGAGKAVVWAHNSHVGDARATEFADRGETNIGALAREKFGDDACLVGFGTHEGTVAAADYWGARVQIHDVRPSLPESWEGICRQTEIDQFILALKQPADPDIADALRQRRQERAIGVIYRPHLERQCHYFKAALAAQFDEFIWFRKTNAVEPLGESRAPDIPDRHPFLLGD